MTVSRHRRRMSTTRAVISSLIGVALALVLGVAGAVAIYNTKDGQVQGSDTPEVQFPATPTGAIAVLDDNGALASLAVFALRPAADDGGDGGDGGEGVGGTVVPVPVSADVSGGIGTERLPLDETVSMFGGETIADEVAVLLGVTIDHVGVVAEEELTDMLAPLADADVTLPAAATGGDGQVIADADVRTLSGERLAAILASRDPSLDAADEYAIDVAVWKAVAGAVGSGLSTPLDLAVGGGPEPTEGSIGELVGRLTAGPISVQAVQSKPIVNVDVNARGVDALALDRVELAVIFGHIAPTRVAAPQAGGSFRVVSQFGDGQLPDGVAGLDVAYTAVRALLELEGNVRSVDAGAGEAPARTIIEVANEALVPAGEVLADVFGPVEIRVAETRIAFIDIVVTLGTDYVAHIGPSAATSGTADTVPGEESMVEGTT